MPEKPEVVTVAKKLEQHLIGKRILKAEVLWPNIPVGISPDEFERKVANQQIEKITTRGKWIVFHLTDMLLLTHLRMEGKFFYRKVGDAIGKHEHVIFTLENNEQLRFHDVRKFGKMMILSKENPETQEPFLSLGLEPWDSSLTSSYLLERYKKKNIPIKTCLLDQKIITGIGNIYADEILFLSKINPTKITSMLSKKECERIIENTKIVLDKAIEEGGTTIRNYTSEEGVTGLFQNHLYVHMREKEKCYTCAHEIRRIKIGGRSTYYCPRCQK